MTNTDYTAICLLFDRSGSMEWIRSDAEGGMKVFIEEQRQLPGKCTIRVAQFDNSYEIVYESTPIAEAAFPQLRPRGSTALLDAWGRCMTEFGEELAALAKDERPGNVVFVVVTDGYENSSFEWTRDKLFAKVTEQTNNWGWQFLYLAAGQDAVAEGAKYGVPSGQSLSYSGKHVNSTYAAASASVTRTRGGGSGAFTDAERDATK